MSLAEITTALSVYLTVGSGVTLNLDPITYTGPQFVYNAYGVTNVTDCTVEIIDTALPVSNEAFEAYQLTLGGKTTISKLGTSNSLIYFRGATASPSLTIAADATVSLSTASYIFYTDSKPSLTVETGASLTLLPTTLFFADTGHYFTSVLIDTGAALTGIQSSSGRNFNCNGDFTVNAGGDVYFENQTSSNPPLHMQSAPRLVLNQLDAFVIYSTTSAAVSFETSTSLTLYAQQINFWTTDTAQNPGGIEYITTYSWRKADDTVLTQVTATLINTATTGVTTNLDSTELSYDLSNLLMNSGRVVSFGNLPLILDQITDDGYPVTGTTAVGSNLLVTYFDGTADQHYTDNADGTGNYSIETDASIPHNTVVIVEANLPFLISWHQSTAEGAGALDLEVSSESLAFTVASLISTSPVRIYGREDDSWSLTISDTRVRWTSWTLYASITEPLTSTVDAAHVLPDALVFVSEDSEVHLLDATPYPVYRQMEAGGDAIEIAWDFDRGLLIQESTNPFYNREAYATEIRWKVNETCVWPLEKGIPFGKCLFICGLTNLPVSP